MATCRQESPWSSLQSEDMLTVTSESDFEDLVFDVRGNALTCWDRSLHVFSESIGRTPMAVTTVQVRSIHSCTLSHVRKPRETARALFGGMFRDVLAKMAELVWRKIRKVMAFLRGLS